MPEAEESITITGHYADNQQCDHISVYFADGTVTREDIAAIIGAIVNAHTPLYERPVESPADIPGIEKWNMNTRPEWFGN